VRSDRNWLPSRRSIVADATVDRLADQVAESGMAAVLIDEITQESA
jgi:hypothetical protein